MGVDTKVYFPPTLRLNRLAIALAALHAIPLRKTRTSPRLPREGRGGEQFYVYCDFVETNSTHTPTMVSIEFTTPYGEKRGLFFHFEADGQLKSGGEGAGWRLLSLGSTARNVAIAKRLVGIFGGRVVYQDCGYKNFSKPDLKVKENPLNAANDGQPYFRMQKLLASIQPLTQAEVEASIKEAAYDYDPNDVCCKGFDDPNLTVKQVPYV